MPGAMPVSLDPLLGARICLELPDDPARNGPTGNGPTGNGPAGNGPAGNGPTGNGPAGNGPAGNGPAGNGPAGNGPAGNGPAGNGPAGNGPAGAEANRETAPPAGARSGGSSSFAGDSLWAVLAGQGGGVLRVETGDERARYLDGQTVWMRIPSVQGSGVVQAVVLVEVLVPEPPPIVLALRLRTEPEVVQRRQWVRVSVQVDVVIEPLGAAGESLQPGEPGEPGEAGGHGDDGGHSDPVGTVTIDLSAGGMKIKSIPGLGMGQLIRAVCYLPPSRTPVEVEGEVIGVDPGETTRIMFRNVREGTSQKLSKFAYDALLADRRRERRALV